MKDGATAVIGGLSKSAEEDVDSGIPYLRKIPWVGQKLFGWKSRQKVQKEILVFVTIGIADPSNLPKDIGLPKNAILGREFVRGNQLEPGDREGVGAKVLKLDMSELDKRGKKKSQGKVTITPANDTSKTISETEPTPAPMPVENAAEPAEPPATPIEPVADTTTSKDNNVSLISALAEEAKEE